MKGERIIAELLGIVGLLLYGALLQHLYAELLHEPERSWLNQGRAWWVTRHSRRRETQLVKVWTRKDAATEPPPA